MKKIIAVGKSQNSILWMLSEIKKQTALPVAVKKQIRNRTALAIGVIVGIVVMLAVWVNYLLNQAR